MSKINGHDEDNNIKAFPDEEERAARALQKIQEEKERKQQQRKPPSEPILNLPPGVKYLSLACALVFALQYLLPKMTEAAFATDLPFIFGFVPARFTGALPFTVEAFVSPVTHIFLHAGWLHLGVNVLSLMAFGAGLEKTLGLKKLILIFLLSGLGGALLQLVLDPGLQAPLIGASGGISGLFGGVLFYLKDRRDSGITSILPFIIIWIGASVLFGQIGFPGAEGPISWAAHLGGFFAGLALYRPIAKLKF